MEEMMMMSKKQTWGTSTTNSCSNALAIHRDSQTISKPKPKIRIIHIFAPEIIKTDVANFRELVQRLTGKPSDNGCTNNKKKRAQGVPRRESEAHQRGAFMAETKKMELMRSTGAGAGFRGFEQFPRSERVIKEEEMMWNADKSGGFLERFADLEGFIQELGEFPMLPNLDSTSASNSHLLHGFEGTQLV
ncbi:hypothetical protein RchiOBHm_Chr3g0479721 [Rosa chinensis]|uniref:VQ domain-containing protein n=1 Tax=Rosa chinensis TaxID=74649 RepID=A0A2P6RDF6_ROSCH|nr:VQ motif-containing protein 25 [Rosa chinensis]PRQ44479.1 hypothetical protein RchiOBHm_Chr3g0479721 [Rosa chinensis]